MGDHTEGVAVDFDPTALSYKALLAHFWSRHDGVSKPYSTQYQNAIFTRNDAQQAAAEHSREAYAETRGVSVSDVGTPIIPIARFTLAEKYHQKYRIGSRNAFREFLNATYPDVKSFADSTVATRLNALFTSQLPADAKNRTGDELTHFGLPDVLEARLRDQRLKHRPG